ncbi:glycosyl hydrolase [Tepidanaerobacter sp. EBM-38]|uniref:glycosyl hydrolase n=1 Tax=Tepidanaerobacter sp. EBM-38 TaxID=1918496 RepID=UPI000A63DD52|nr:glycosyl hydrolase [Tepidanaerobacter sp. EBM-38]
MKVTFKKYTSAVVVSIFICALFANCIQASTLSYNTLYSSFQSALKAGSNDEIIKYAENLAAVLESGQISSTSYKAFMLGRDTEQVSIEKALVFYEIALKYAPADKIDHWTGGVAARLYEMANLCFDKGDYDNASKLYKKYLPYAVKLGWKDGANIAKARIVSADIDLDLYTKDFNKRNVKYYGAKYEPHSGIYFGSTYDRDDRIGTYKFDEIKTFFPKKDAAYLIYYHWGDDIASLDRFFNDAVKNKIGIQLAWNIADGDKQTVINNIESYKNYIENIAKYLNKKDIPVFLRFACEMNDNELGSNPTAYIKAFQFVHDIMEQCAPKVAMVWSPNDIGRDDSQYYPGDEYVDWVGVSSYTIKYFQGQKNWSEQQEIYDSRYFTGGYANPIAKLKQITQKYGNRKPIMISETGIPHRFKIDNEDLTEWAKIQMKRLYVYGPMVYPELKGIYYFNVDLPSLKYYDYAFYNNPAMNGLYNELIKDNYFISNIGEDSPYSYYKIENYETAPGEIPLYLYVSIPRVLKPTVTYRLNGNWIATLNEIPYAFNLNTKTIPQGKHIFTVEVFDGDKKLKSKNYELTINGDTVDIKSL